jgi:hypothetical protein
MIVIDLASAVVSLTFSGLDGFSESPVVSVLSVDGLSSVTVVDEEVSEDSDLDELELSLEVSVVE